MLDLPQHPVLDKPRLIGGCARLPIDIDVARLRTEVESLPDSMWGTTGGRVGVHRNAEAIFLRGYAPAEGNKPIEDRDSLSLVPYVREIIESRIEAPPLRCLLARMAGGGKIAPHVDQAPYFAKSLRIHMPIVTHDKLWMVCAGLSYRMRPGEVWALNNNAPHGVWNADPTLSRTHLICDFLPSPVLLGLLDQSDRTLGRDLPEVNAALAQVAA